MARVSGLTFLPKGATCQPAVVRCVGGRGLFSSVLTAAWTTTTTAATMSMLRTTSPLQTVLPAARAVAVRTSPRTLVPVRTLFTRRQVSAPRKWGVRAMLAAGSVVGLAYYFDSRSAVHQYVLTPLVRSLFDAETAHRMAVLTFASGLGSRDLVADDPVLAATLFGKSLSNPIGVAAGFDKNAEAVDGLFNVGFGLVEVGSVTPVAQPGNPQPRFFRLPADRAVINRYGFNSDGIAPVLARLESRVRAWLRQSAAATDPSIVGTFNWPETINDLLPGAPGAAAALVDAAGSPRSLHPDHLLAINLGKNKTSAEADVSDYVQGVQSLGPFADLLVVNVSSPNTPGLRKLQRKGVLNDLLKQVVEARDEMVAKAGFAQLPAEQAPNGTVLGARGIVPLLVKIAPDLSGEELADVADAASEAGVDGIIVSNTTIQRPASLISTKHVDETGGLSGAPLKPLALHALRTVRERVGADMTLIGCGGITTGQDALDFARAGASAVELYTSFGYEGVGLPRRVKDELAALLREQHTTWAAEVGRGAAAGATAATATAGKDLNAAALEDAYSTQQRELQTGIKSLREAVVGPRGSGVGAVREATKAQEADALEPYRAAVRALPFAPDDAEYVELLAEAQRAAAAAAAAA